MIILRLAVTSDKGPIGTWSDGRPTVVPTKIRGNGNNHHSGVHSVTKVKNIDLIHLGKYFIKLLKVNVF